MFCDECKRRPATVHMTKIVNGEKVEARLCEQCAQSKGGFSGFIGFPAAMQMSMQQFLAGMLQGAGVVQGSPVEYPGAVRCQCGMSFTDFANMGRLGCDKCYTTFAEEISPVLRRIHGSSRHIGKVPIRSGGAARLRRDIANLREELKCLISQEKYEEAAKARDNIRELEKQLSDKREGV